LHKSAKEFVVLSNVIILPGRALILPHRAAVFYDLTISSGVPQKKYSVLWCIHEALLAQGKTPRWRIEEKILPSPVFGMLDAIVLSIRRT